MLSSHIYRCGLFQNLFCEIAIAKTKITTEVQLCMIKWKRVMFKSTVGNQSKLKFLAVHSNPVSCIKNSMIIYSN